MAKDAGAQGANTGNEARFPKYDKKSRIIEFKIRSGPTQACRPPSQDGPAGAGPGGDGRGPGRAQEEPEQAKEGEIRGLLGRL